MPEPTLVHRGQSALGGASGDPSVEIWTLFAIGVCATLLRMYSRVSVVGFRDLRADDLLVWVGIIFYAAQSALGYEVGKAAHGMANNSMTPTQRETLSPSDPEYHLRVTGSKLQVAGWAIYAALIWSLKLSMLSFYIRLTTGLQGRYRTIIYIGFALVVSSFIAVILVIFLACRPLHKYWQIYPDPGNICKPAVSRAIVWASFAANISTDIYLILIPIPMLWGSSLKMYKKIASTIVFSSGLLVLVCATLKTVAVLVEPVTGAKLAAEWGIREAFVAVMTTNLPMIFHLFRTWLRPLLGKALGSSGREAYKPRTGFQTIGGGGGDHSSRSRQGNLMNTVTSNTTFSNSEERIIGNMKMEDMKPITESDTSRDGGILVSNQVEITRENSSTGTPRFERDIA